MQLKSQKITTDEANIYANIYKGYFEIERQGETKEINEPLITNEAVATKRAIAEFLEYGNEKQEVTFTTYFSPLKINDIIKVYAPRFRVPKDLLTDRFIIKKIQHKFKDGAVITTIGAERYD